MPANEVSQGENITTMYITTWCPFCRNVKRWMDSHDVPYKMINVEEDDEAAKYVMSVNGGNRTVPTVVFPDQSVIANPSAAQLAQKFPQAVSN